MKVRAYKPTAEFTSACPQTAMNDDPASLGVTYSQHVEFPSRCWLSGPGLLLKRRGIYHEIYLNGKIEITSEISVSTRFNDLLETSLDVKFQEGDQQEFRKKVILQV